MEKKRGRGRKGGAHFERRRDEILCAARGCFSAKGFHGTSIADLSKSSGMSSGQIYHYFENKEAVVEAIAAAALEEVLEAHADILNRSDMLEALISHTVETAIRFSRVENARLRLEILSEATRNARVAGIVAGSDQRWQASTLRILKRINESRTVRLSDIEIECQLELLGALLSGFLVRSVTGRHVGEDALRKSLYHAFRFILAADCASWA